MAVRMTPALEQTTATDATPGIRSGFAAGATRLLSATVFYTLLALLPLTAVPYGAFNSWWKAAIAALVFALAALWAVEGALSGRWFGRAHLLTLPPLALAAFAYLQTVPLAGGRAISFDPYETRLVATELFACALAFGLLLRYLDSGRRLRALLYTVIGLGVACALFGIIRQTTQRGEQGFLLPYLVPSAGYAQFINKNHFGYLAEMTLGLALGVVAGRGVARGRSLVYLAAALPLWAAVVLSGSRGAVFAMLCQVIFLGVTFGATRPRGTPGEASGGGDSLLARAAYSPASRVALVVILLASIVVGMVWLGGDQFAERIESARVEAEAAGGGGPADASRADPTRAGRAEIWKATWKLFEAHPLAGVGLGGYWVAVTGTHEGSGGLVPQQAHNDYLELLASGGAVGAALFVAFLVLFARRARGRLRAGTQYSRAAALGALTGLFGVAVHSLVEFGLHAGVNALACVALLAAASADTGAGGGGPESKN
jgi:O-antigen ligase